MNKEAERCADGHRMSDDYSSAEPYDIGYANGLEIGFQKGAEFGYNKGKNEAKEIIKQLMRAIPYGSGKLATESYDKAEQFLKETE